MQNKVTIKGDINVKVPLELFNETVVNNLNEDQIFDILLQAVKENKMSASNIVERFKDDYKDELDEIIAEASKELEYFKESTVGLYAFDCPPSKLLEKFNASQSDAHSIECGEFEKLNEDWARFFNDENHIKSPFEQIN